MRPRVAFLGSPAFAVPSLEALIAAADVRLVVTQPDRPAGRGRRPEPTPVRRAAAAHDLPVRIWERGAGPELARALTALELDALVVVAFGVILAPSTLAAARLGALNVHPSLLPRWRGVAPIERAILAGDHETGVSLMVIDAGVDTGPVMAAVRETIAAGDTRVSLSGRLAARGAALLASELEPWVAGRRPAVPQSDVGVTYAPRLEKEEGRIDWSRDAAVVDRQVRGLYEWPGAVTRLAGADLKVHAVGLDPSPVAAPPGTLVEADARRGVRVACGSGSLVLLELQLAGKPRVDARALVRGRVLRPGLVLGS